MPSGRGRFWKFWKNGLMSTVSPPPKPGRAREIGAHRRTKSRAVPADIEASASDLAATLTSSPDDYVPLSPTTIRLGQEGVGLSDVQGSLERYRRQEALLRATNRGFPCIQLREDLPLPVSLLPTENESGHSQGLLAASEQASVPQVQYDVREYDHDEARGFLRRRLSAFLAFRLLGQERHRFGVRDVLRSGIPPVLATRPGAPAAPGLPFTVETPGREGLRIHYSPAMFFEPWHQFGSTLSTPVHDWLRPGVWVFGGKAEGEDLRWDLDVAYELPDDRVALLQLS
jgi:hypothetical protein